MYISFYTLQQNSNQAMSSISLRNSRSRHIMTEDIEYYFDDDVDSDWFIM